MITSTSNSNLPALFFRNQRKLLVAIVGNMDGVRTGMEIGKIWTYMNSVQKVSYF